MPRIIWLVYERPPHPDAVSYPAVEPEVRLVLDLLALPCPRRLHLAEQLWNFLSEQAGVPLWDRKAVPCRCPSGLYRPVPWRLAKWLAHVLPAGEGVIERTRARLRRWLGEAGEAEVVRAAS